MGKLEDVSEIKCKKYPVGAFRIRFSEPVGVVTVAFNLLRKCHELLQDHTINGPHKVPFRNHDDACAVLKDHAVISAELSELYMAGIQGKEEVWPSICIGTTKGEGAHKNWDIINRTDSEVFEQIHNLLRQFVRRDTR